MKIKKKARTECTQCGTAFDGAEHRVKCGRCRYIDASKRLIKQDDRAVLQLAIDAYGQTALTERTGLTRERLVEFRGGAKMTFDERTKLTDAIAASVDRTFQPEPLEHLSWTGYTQGCRG